MKRAMRIGLFTFALFWAFSAFAQKKEKKQEASPEKPALRFPARSFRFAGRESGPGVFPRIFELRPASPAVLPASYPVKSEKLFDGWLGRVEDVLRTKRLFRIEAEKFRVDASYERQYFHGNPQHPSYASPVPASGWRMGIRLKL